MRRSVSRDSEPQSKNRGITLLLGKKTTYLVDEKDRVIPSANIPPSSVGAVIPVAPSAEYVTVPQILKGMVEVDARRIEHGGSSPRAGLIRGRV